MLLHELVECPIRADNFNKLVEMLVESEDEQENKYRGQNDKASITHLGCQDSVKSPGQHVEIW